MEYTDGEIIYVIATELEKKSVVRRERIIEAVLHHAEKKSLKKSFRPLSSNERVYIESKTTNILTLLRFRKMLKGINNISRIKPNIIDWSAETNGSQGTDGEIEEGTAVTTCNS